MVCLDIRFRTPKDYCHTIAVNENITSEVIANGQNWERIIQIQMTAKGSALIRNEGLILALAGMN